MHPVGPNRFDRPLSDAAGPVDVDGERRSAAIIRYTMKDGHLKFVQRMQLQADGRTVSNHVMRVRSSA